MSSCGIVRSCAVTVVLYFIQCLAPFTVTSMTKEAQSFPNASHTASRHQVKHHALHTACCPVLLLRHELDAKHYVQQAKIGTRTPTHSQGTIWSHRMASNSLLIAYLPLLRSAISQHTASPWYTVALRINILCASILKIVIRPMSQICRLRTLTTCKT